MRRLAITVFLCLAPCLLPHAPAFSAHLEERDGLTIAYLEGSPYEIGRQHGELLKHDVQQVTRQLLGYVRGYVKIPFVGPRLADWWLDRPWRQALPSIPNDYLEELRGLSDGSGVPLKELWRIHAIPDRTYACAGLAVWGKATTGGRLIHTRNLDWNINIGIQRYPVVFVVRPTGKHAFVNLGWAGFVGVLSGINDRSISIGQIGAETSKVSYRGLPMVLLMRKVLEESGDVDEAVRLIQTSPRTIGTNYIIADARVPRAVAIETTYQYAKVFEANDIKERGVAYARPIPEAVLRADAAVDAAIRERQVASGGNPRKSGTETPTGSAYEIRYLGQAAGILANYGRITPEVAKQIAQTVAPNSNIQSVIFAWPDVWVANADGRIRAADTAYHRLDLRELFSR